MGLGLHIEVFFRGMVFTRRGYGDRTPLILINPFVYIRVSSYCSGGLENRTI